MEIKDAVKALSALAQETRLTIFRLLGKHLIGALSGIYVAAFIGHMIGSLWPSARLTAFVIAAGFFVISELCVTLRELRRGPQSTGSIILDFMPFLLLGTGVSLFIGRLASQWFGSDSGGVVVFAGVYYAIICVICGVKYRVQERNLQQDLEHPQHVDPEEVARETREGGSVNALSSASRGDRPLPQS